MQAKWRAGIVLVIAACGGDDAFEPRPCDEFANEVVIWRSPPDVAAQRCLFVIDPAVPVPLNEAWQQTHGYPMEVAPNDGHWSLIGERWLGDEPHVGAVVRAGGDECRWVRAAPEPANPTGYICQAAPEID